MQSPRWEVWVEFEFEFWVEEEEDEEAEEVPGPAGSMTRSWTMGEGSMGRLSAVERNRGLEKADLDGWTMDTCLCR